MDLILHKEAIHHIWKLHMDGLSAGMISMETGLLLTRIKDILAGKTYGSLRPTWAVKRTPPQERQEESIDLIFGTDRV